MKEEGHLFRPELVHPCAPREAIFGSLPKHKVLYSNTRFSASMLNMCVQLILAVSRSAGGGEWG